MDQRVTPYLFYADPVAALGFLSSAFGFRETSRLTRDDGRVYHAEMGLEGGMIMLGSAPRDYRNPSNLGGVTQLIHVYVDDVDAHFAHARAAGAVIDREPADQHYGDRTYSAFDPEGHQWYFATKLRETAPD